MADLLCPIRRRRVSATPEEQVRASFLLFLLDKGYPKELILVERALKDLPHARLTLDRRVDILCYDRALRPLLLVECKESAMDSDFSQLLGYNYHVMAASIALASRSSVLLKDASGGDLPFGAFPTFPQLCALKDT